MVAQISTPKALSSRPISRLQKIVRLFYTIRHFSLHQLVFFIERRFIRRIFKIAPRHILSRKQGLDALITLPGDLLIYKPLMPLNVINSEAIFRDNAWTFLNVVSAPIGFDTLGAIRPGSDGIDWQAKQQSRLWCYNMHYFDWLNDQNTDVDMQRAIILHWIESNRLALKGVAQTAYSSKEAWEPYTLSLRLVNWVKFLSRSTPDSADNIRIVASLIEQAAWLKRNMEYHIRANHLLKNWVALLAVALSAPFYYSDKQHSAESEDYFSWVFMGLRKEIDLQFKHDGGHYERSPMYHSIALQDLLDIAQMLNSSVDSVPPFSRESFLALQHCVNQKIGAAFHFLSLVTLSDNGIARFSDSCFGIAPSLEALSRYADKLKIVIPQALGAPKDDATPFQLQRADASGFYRFRCEQYDCIVSAGAPSPDYQPGHTHCDLGSFELLVRGTRVITDIGVYEYAPGARRHYSRATHAHNVLQVGDQEQHHIWGEFRVAQRAKVSHLQCSERSLEFCHDGFDGALCHRQFQWDSHGLSVSDTLRVKVGAKQPQSVQSYLHFGPEVDVKPHKDRYWLISHASSNAKGLLAVLEVDEGCDVAHEIVEYYPEFGRVSRVNKLSMKLPIANPLTCGYRLILDDVEVARYL